MTSARFMSYLWYPLLFGAAIGLYVGMTEGGRPLMLALYAPIALAALAIVALEQLVPERLNWRPHWIDVRADAMFMIAVQVILPRILFVTVVLMLSGRMHDQAPSPWWPHSWQLVCQTLLMVLAVDLGRYWLHRACHRFDVLWRLHKVHHSPDKLYSLNVGRFHPVEKALHFSVDTVPFVVLGVDPVVIAGYFLLYSVNGFFQHSNVRLRYGWLNYLVGSAQTHRWHHAKDPGAAACNYSNTTIVWDLVFRTWYLPPELVVGAVGIPDEAYPKGFWSQMFTPFRRATNALSRRTLKTRVLAALIKPHLHVAWLWSARRIAASARDPMRIQRTLLARILHDNRATTFGREHGFDQIRDHREFAKRVPVREYEGLRHFVEAEVERGTNALTEAAPVCYLRTSGTTGRPKDIPLTRAHLNALRRINRTAVAFQYRNCPAAFDGSILAITSPAREGTLANGRFFGSASGIVSDSTPALIAAQFVVPAPVLSVTDSQLKYLLILRLALSRPDMSYLGTANASTLLALIRLYREHASALIEDLRHGSFFLAHKVPAEIWSSISGRMADKNPERAIALASFQARPGGARIADLWPELRLVVTWCCASAGVAVSALKSELDPGTRVLELGYVASEFRGTLTLGRQPGSGMPTLDSHFFEFAERDQWDRGEAEFLTIDRIRKGVDYYIIVTTPSGLYRYFINDLVRVTGFLHRTPLLKFLQKGKGVTNITGEKLYESQVLAATRSATLSVGCATRFVMMVADEESRSYRLYVEPQAGSTVDPQQLAQSIDAMLMELNLEYRSKRESARLGPLTLAWLVPHTWEAYKKACVVQGQRESQFKPAALAYRNKMALDLEAFIESR